MMFAFLLWVRDLNAAHSSNVCWSSRHFAWRMKGLNKMKKPYIVSSTEVTLIKNRRKTYIIQPRHSKMLKITMMIIRNGLGVYHPQHRSGLKQQQMFLNKKKPLISASSLSESAWSPPGLPIFNISSHIHINKSYILLGILSLDIILHLQEFYIIVCRYNRTRFVDLLVLLCCSSNLFSGFLILNELFNLIGCYLKSFSLDQ